jgi:hypothetical protein
VPERPADAYGAASSSLYSLRERGYVIDLKVGQSFGEPQDKRRNGLDIELWHRLLSRD